MTEIIYTSTKNRINDTTTEISHIEDTISIVRSEKYQAVTEEVRVEQNDEKRRKLKSSSLPAFYPTIAFGEGKRATIDKDSTPTGIIQFDVDVKDNPDLDFPELRKRVTQIEECIYTFASPSGGLKFGILTDFAREPDQDKNALCVRFRQAYSRCLKWVIDQCRIEFNDDRAGDNIVLACYLPHDPNAFFRVDCARLSINHRCVYIAPTYEVPETADESEVAEILGNIPNDLRWNQRKAVNLCVLHMLGQMGIPLLMSHWRVDNPEKLRRDLNSMLSAAKYGSLTLLHFLAIQHGYIGPTGSQRRNLRPKPSTITLPSLLSPVDAKREISAAIEDFFSSEKSQFLNITTGTGKTRMVLEALVDKLPTGKRVLYLVRNHDLGAEIVEVFRQIQKERAMIGKSRRDKFTRITIKQLKGKESTHGLCVHPDQKKFEDSKIPMPKEMCIDSCVRRTVCPYIEQFNNPFLNIRVMTHDQYRNDKQSTWFEGATWNEEWDKNEPMRDGPRWHPDYIVVDEDVFQVKRPIAEIPSTRFPSISAIIKELHSGKSFADAVSASQDQIFIDGGSNKHEKFPHFPTIGDAKNYIEAYQRSRKKDNFSVIIDRLHKYCRHSDSSYLDGMWVEDGAIYWAEVKVVSDRYSATPTLFLDATANRMVAHKLLPHVEFRSVSVRSKADINLRQMCNKTFTKRHFQDVDQRRRTVDGLRKIAANYNNVGLITYKQIEGEDNFHQNLADEIGVPNVAYFGNLRGSNSLEKVDCLLVVGRNMLAEDDTKNHIRAIFNGSTEGMKTSKYAYQPVRMKDGTVRKMNSHIGKDEHHQAIYEHFSRAETLQAIGRARPVHGCPKDIFVFANENLGSDTEVTVFFAHEDYFEGKPKPVKELLSAEAIRRIKERGYLYFVPRELRDKNLLGLKESQYEGNYEKIEAELVNAGFTKQSLIVCYKSGNKAKPRTYFIYESTDMLEQALLADEMKLMGPAPG